MTPEQESIARRVEDLEKQVAHLAAVVTEQSDPDRAVEAQSFVVRDEQGQRRAELGMVIPVGMAEAHPWLGLFDAKERVRACIGVDTQGPWLELYNADGKSIAEAREFPEGPRVALFDADEKQLLTLEVDERESKIVLFGPDGIARAALAVSPDGPWLDLRDTNGFRAEIGSANLLREAGVTHKTSTASITLSGKDGKVIWSAP